MNLYVAYTGGTIGMVPSENGFIPDSAFAETVAACLNAYQPEHTFTVSCYERLIDSSNATPEDWLTIGQDIADRWQDFDGFLVLHGTDTMAYTSSALAFMFQRSRKPIVVTGSQIPMVKARNDALANLYGAVDALLHGPAGVFLHFNGLHLEGARARKVHTSDLRAFQSPNFPARGELGIEWQWRKVHEPKQPEQIQLPEMKVDQVTLLPVFPGVTAAHWQGLLGDGVKGAVLLSYGAGNGPDQNQALLDALKEATDRGVVIVNVSQCGSGAVSASTYAAGSALVKAGVISALDMTFEAAFCKLHFLLAQSNSAAEVRSAFTTPLAYDITRD